MADTETEVTVELQETGLVEGVENPTFESGELTIETQVESEVEEELPTLTYIDFVPLCMGTEVEGKEPEYDNFKSVVEQANQWLISMPQFSVYKCETLTFRLGAESKLDADQTLAHVSSNGKNNYIMVLRLWLVPRVDATPVQQLAYITVLPDHSSGDLLGFLGALAGRQVATGVAETALPSFDKLSLTLEKLNKHLAVKPLPGRILSVETLQFKAQESNTADKLEAEATSWSEGGANTMMHVFGFRVFYVLGQPAYESIGFYDELPEMSQHAEIMGLKVKFANFTSLTTKGGKWLKTQQGIRVVNLQSLNVKLDRKTGTGPWMLEPDSPCFTTTKSLQECRYSKILRVHYVKDQKLDNPSPYAPLTLTSRIFVPIRLVGKNFESFSKTMLRVIKWLHATRIPVFACETVRYQVNADGEGQGFNDERPDYLVNTYSGRYYLTCIRLYFPSVYQEPPEEIDENEEVAWGWGCVVS